MRIVHAPLRARVVPPRDLVLQYVHKVALGPKQRVPERERVCVLHRVVHDVERARAGLHRAGLGLAHLGHGHEKVGVQGRFCCALDCAWNLRTRRGVVGGRRTLVEERVRLFDLFYELLRCKVSCMALCIFPTG